MQKKLFRQTALENARMPNNLKNTIQVTSTGVWLVLIAGAALLIGVCVWSIFGLLESKIEVQVYVKDGTATVSIPAKYDSMIKPGMKVDVDGRTIEIETVTDQVQSGMDFLGSLVNSDIKLDEGTIPTIGGSIYNALIEPMRETIAKAEGVKDGLYFGTLTLERIRPISFLVN